jgi:hypothetical protein
MYTDFQGPTEFITTKHYFSCYFRVGSTKYVGPFCEAIIVQQDIGNPFKHEKSSNAKSMFNP